MAQLWDLGVRGTTLDVVAAWKEALLLVALLVVAWHVRRLAGRQGGGRPRGDLRGRDRRVLADPAGLCSAARRRRAASCSRSGITSSRSRRTRSAGSPRSRGRSAAGSAASSRCRRSSSRSSASSTSRSSRCRRGATPAFPAGTASSSGSTTRGSPASPRTGSTTRATRTTRSGGSSRRSSRRSRARTSLVVALIYVVSRPFRWWWGLLALLLYVALLYTHTRAALAALAFGLVVLALAQRRIAPAVLAARLGRRRARSSSPPTRRSGRRRATRRRSSSGSARTRSSEGGASGDPFAGNEASTESHWRNLRDGVRVVIEHPQGYGLGNAGVVAKRTGVEIRAGESTYTELGVDAGVAGVARVRPLEPRAPRRAVADGRRGSRRRSRRCSLLGLQTDVIGVHWIAFTVWVAAGLALGLPRTDQEHRAEQARAACGAALVRVLLPLPSSEAGDDRC